MLATMPEQAVTVLHSLGGLLQYQSLVIATVLGLLGGCGLRALLLVALDRGQSWPRIGVRALVAAAYGALAFGYAGLLAKTITWDRRHVVALSLGAGLMIVGLLFWRLVLGSVPRLTLTGWLLRAVLLLSVVVLMLLSLMRAGFLNLTTDLPVLRIEVTGETRPQTVRFAAPDQPMQELSLRAHRVLFRTPGGELLTEEWIYGDQVAIKGRVLRLHPLLNSIGIPNWFELQFLHNGYFTAERHSSQPHVARKLVMGGSLTVAPEWQPQRDRILHWLQTRPEQSQWAIRAATSESTYFPLIDAQGRAQTHTFELVLTPGGLTAR